MAQEIYHRSEWGNPNEQWGNVYLNADLTNELYKRASEYENSWVTDQLLNGVGTKPSIIMTPTAYEDGLLNSVKPAPSLGVEQIENGDFATDSNWTKGTGWTISGGTANATSVSSGAPISQYIDTGKKYKITYDVVSLSQGAFQVDLSYSGTALGQLVTTTGTFTDIVTSINPALSIRVVGTTTGSIDNVSAKEVIDADFDFTRGSSATRVNEKGLIQDVQILSDELVQNGNFEQIGSELVTNGSFDTDSDWTKGTGWSISGGKAVANNSPSSVYQSTGSNYTSGKTYKIEFTVSDYVSGSVRPEITNIAGSFVSSNGTFTQYIVATSSPIGEELKGNAFTGSIDNVSVKEVGQNWTLTSGATIEDGQLVLSASASLYQSIPLTVGKKYRVKYEITSIDAGSSGITVYGGSNSGTRREEVGTYTEDIIQSGSGLLFFFTGGGFNSGTIDNVSIIEITDDTDLPRINYTNFDYENGEVVPYSGEGSLLLEPQSTNLVTYSEDFTGWAFTSVSTTLDNNVISPSGVSGVQKLIASSGNSFHFTNFSVTISGKYSFSVFIKKGTSAQASMFLSELGNFGGIFDLENGLVESVGGSDVEAKIEHYGNDWYRCILNHTSTDDLNNSIRIGVNNGALSGFDANGDEAIYIWGAQVEALSYATSYIPTNGSTVTRLADICNNAGSSDLINSTEGVLYAEISALDLSETSSRRLGITKNGTYEGLRLQFGNGNISAIVYDGTTNQYNKSVNIDNSIFHKVALKYKTNDFALWIDGIEYHPQSSGSTFSDGTLDDISFDYVGGNPFYGNVKCVAVFKEALSDTELQKLTQV